MYGCAAAPEEENVTGLARECHRPASAAHSRRLPWDIACDMRGLYPCKWKPAVTPSGG